MCGIAGLFGGGPLSNARQVADALGTSVSHRGPDGAGALLLPAPGERASVLSSSGGSSRGARGVLVHRRLTILDLVTGEQPMSFGDGRYWIVFNGEIYNFRELRRQLEACGARFRTASDTEVLLAVYAHHGVDGFARLNGMFALAIYDETEQRIVLARDPLGIKPLYWGRVGGKVWFGSELRAARRAGLLGDEIDREALLQYVFYRFVPSPRTLLAGAAKVVPGSAMTFDAGGALLDQRAFAPEPGATRRVAEPAGMLAEELRAAVARQMVADVPVGAFLSGGVDSSLVVALMQAVNPQTATFAVGFRGGDQDEGELAVAANAAAMLGTSHRERSVDADSYFRRLPEAVATVEEPLAHVGMSLQCDLAALARGHVKVALTGQGADEPLGGYSRHQATRIAPLLRALTGKAGRWMLARRPGQRREAFERLLRLVFAPPGVSGAAAMFGALTVEDANALLARPVYDPQAVILGAIEPWWQRGSAMDPVARALFVDARTSLADDLLLVADKTAMANSLETRVPFLDLEYLRAVESIHGHQRVAVVGHRKPLQLEVARRTLPSAMADRFRAMAAPWRRKAGFDAPVGRWLRSSDADLPALLCGRSAVLPEFLSRQRVASLVANEASHSPRTRFALVALELWLRSTLTGNADAATAGERESVEHAPIEPLPITSIGR